MKYYGLRDSFRNPSSAFQWGGALRRVPSVLLCAVLIGLTGCQSPPAPKAPEARPAAGWTEQQQATLRKLGFTPHGDDWDLSLASSLLFEFNADQLKPEQTARLREMGLRLREVGVPRLRVEGHTDAIGDPNYNRDLSSRRATAVATLLVTTGWSRDLIEVRGLGRDRPIADNSTESGRAQNRRVVVIAKAL